MSRKGPTPPRPWGKWEETRTVRNAVTGEETTLLNDSICFTNNLYTVIGRRLAPDVETSPSMVWLSIRRNDRKPARDWRHLQRIKNELVGPECEGVEIFPAESRLVDQANQTHLWVILDPQFRWPFGFNEGRITMEHDDPEVTEIGAVQRPFETEAAAATAEIRRLIHSVEVEPLDMGDGHCDRCGEPCEHCEHDRVAT